MLADGGRFAGVAEGRVPLDMSHEGLSTGGLSFEQGANCDRYEVVTVGRRAMPGGKVKVTELGKWVVL
eukprot:4151794-Prymnesium_polylepis.1